MKLGLGTAQFGLAYGISGRGQQVALAAVKAILERARANGVSTLDTAPAYGGSETVLGECLAGRGGFDIVTKTVAIGSDRIQPADIARVEDTFFRSLAHLRVESVDTVLVHSANDLLAKGGDQLYALLARWRVEGRTRKLGVSVYTGSQIEALLARHAYDVVQLPVSVFDQRLVADGTLESLKDANVEIHARSVLLQGLALMEPLAIPQGLALARPLVERFQRTMAEWGISPLAGSLRYVAQLEAVDRLLVGVHSVEHLDQCLSALQALDTQHDYSAFACENEAIIDPRQWSAT